MVSCFFFLRQGDDLTAATTRASVPLPTAFVPEAPRKITEEEREFQAYRTLRNERATARHEGKRKVREAKVSNLFYLRAELFAEEMQPLQKAEEEANKKK